MNVNGLLHDVIGDNYFVDSSGRVSEKERWVPSLDWGISEGLSEVTSKLRTGCLKEASHGKTRT